MLCALSGEAPDEPVASKKSGHVFEKRLIESYIADNGKDPITEEELTVEDLIVLQTARAVKPRPPTLTSIPSLLTAFQNEWDTLTLEHFTLQQSLKSTKQELSTALYNSDAAARVITRLTKERDEARDALSKLSVSERRPAASQNAASTPHGDAGDAMDVDQTVLPQAVANKIDETKQRLTATRRKRPVPQGWTSPDRIQSFRPIGAPDKLVPPGSQALAVDSDGKLALIGGLDGAGCLYSIPKRETIRVLEASSKSITDVLCLDLEQNLTTAVATSTGAVKIFEGESEVKSFDAHDGAAVALALHPSRDILASTGEDSKTVLYDLVEKRVLAERTSPSGVSKCCQFHPDGHLLAVGTNARDNKNGFINIFDVTTMSVSAQFKLTGPICAMSFSENGFWLAVALQGDSNVEIWDLRKSDVAHKLNFGGRVEALVWDYTGQYLAAGGPNNIAVQHWDKSSKSWSQLVSKAASITALQWGPLATGLAVLYADGSLGAITAAK